MKVKTSQYPIFMIKKVCKFQIFHLLTKEIASISISTLGKCSVDLQVFIEIQDNGYESYDTLKN